MQAVEQQGGRLAVRGGDLVADDEVPDQLQKLDLVALQDLIGSCRKEKVAFMALALSRVISPTRLIYQQLFQN